MDIFDIGGISTKLRRFLKRFQSCSADERARDYFQLYVNGLISNLPRKNCEAIALQVGVPVRSMQWFLSGQGWDHERMLDKLQKIIAKKHDGKHSKRSRLQTPGFRLQIFHSDLKPEVRSPKP